MTAQRELEGISRSQLVGSLRYVNEHPKQLKELKKQYPSIMTLPDRLALAMFYRKPGIIGRRGSRQARGAEVGSLLMMGAICSVARDLRDQGAGRGLSDMLASVDEETVDDAATEVNSSLQYASSLIEDYPGVERVVVGASSDFKVMGGLLRRDIARGAIVGAILGAGTICELVSS